MTFVGKQCFQRRFFLFFVALPFYFFFLLSFSLITYFTCLKTHNDTHGWVLWPGLLEYFMVLFLRQWNKKIFFSCERLYGYYSHLEGFHQKSQVTLSLSLHYTLRTKLNNKCMRKLLFKKKRIKNRIRSRFFLPFWWTRATGTWVLWSWTCAAYYQNWKGFNLISFCTRIILFFVLE